MTIRTRAFLANAVSLEDSYGEHSPIHEALFAALHSLGCQQAKAQNSKNDRAHIFPYLYQGETVAVLSHWFLPDDPDDQCPDVRLDVEKEFLRQHKTRFAEKMILFLVADAMYHEERWIDKGETLSVDTREQIARMCAQELEEFFNQLG